jgi:SAM-dependent methyltransferase
MKNGRYPIVDHYTEAFYDRAEQSRQAAAAIVAIVKSLLPIRSVADIGCARGTWLAAWQADGCEDVFGIDSGWAGRERLLIPPDRFIEADLSRPFNLGRRFDLVQCLEVAEHLPGARSEGLVDDLTAHASVVLFSAAPPGQGGAGHINERTYEFWRELFAARGYMAFDCIRPQIAGRPDIPYWYRYNILLYTRTEDTAFGLPGRLPPAKPVPDVSPPLFRLRKTLFRRLPPFALDRLAALNARLRPKR